MQRMHLVAPSPVTTPPDNPLFTIRVDRNIRPTYPRWVKRLVHPELECSGPSEFDLSRLNRPLNLQDGMAFQKNEAVFRKFFGTRTAFLFMSLVEDRFGSLRVPFVVSEEHGPIELGWMITYCDWLSECPDAHFVRYEV